MKEPSASIVPSKNIWHCNDMVWGDSALSCALTESDGIYPICIDLMGLRIKRGSLLYLKSQVTVDLWLFNKDTVD